MRHKANAVSIVATAFDGQRTGLTATSVCSLSDAPPTLLICVNRDSRAHDMILARKLFSVNLLAAGQSDIAREFSGTSPRRGDDRFQAGQWHESDGGIPLLNNALAVLLCRLSDAHDFTTHSIILGTVAEAQVDINAEPLIYLHGRYRRLDPLGASQETQRHTRNPNL